MALMSGAVASGSLALGSVVRRSRHASMRINERVASEREAMSAASCKAVRGKRQKRKTAGPAVCLVFESRKNVRLCGWNDGRFFFDQPAQPCMRFGFFRFTRQRESRTKRMNELRLFTRNRVGVVDASSTA